jgi:hypothetical protein
MSPVVHGEKGKASGRKDQNGLYLWIGGQAEKLCGSPGRLGLVG